MLQEKKMRITLAFTIALIAVLVFGSSMYLIRQVGQASEKSMTSTVNNSNSNAGGGVSSSNQNIGTDSNQPSRSNGDKNTEDSAPIDGIFSNASSGTPSDKSNAEPVENATATGNVVPPDGRIYTGGEGPYAYVPTYSRKGQPLPIAPLTPNDQYP